MTFPILPELTSASDPDGAVLCFLVGAHTGGTLTAFGKCSENSAFVPQPIRTHAMRHFPHFTVEETEAQRGSFPSSRLIFHCSLQHHPKT